MSSRQSTPEGIARSSDYRLDCRLPRQSYKVRRTSCERVKRVGKTLRGEGETSSKAAKRRQRGRRGREWKEGYVNGGLGMTGG